MKYELTNETKVVDDVTLYRIKRISDGVLGGFVESEKNLSQDGECWVFDDAMVFGKAKVYGNALVSSKAQVFENAWVSGDALVCGDAQVYGDAWVCGDALVYGDAMVYDSARVSGDARVYGNALVSGNARVYGYAQVSGNAQVCGDAQVSSDAKVCGDAQVYGDAMVKVDTLTEKHHCVNITNLEFNITITPNYMTIGCQTLKKQEWLKVTKEAAMEMGLSAGSYELFVDIIRAFSKS